MDLDGDSIKDIVSGSDTRGDVYLFRGLGNGAYAPGVKLHDSSGRPARAGRMGGLSGTAVSVADWNGDGVLDLVLGDVKGRVWLLTGAGKREGLPIFEAPRAFELVEVEPVPRAAAGPVVVDWDGDGISDLLVGYDYGPVVFYKGLIEEGAHILVPGEVLLQPCYADEPIESAKNAQTGAFEPVLMRSHRRAKLAVWDWNGDGRLDLLVGDSAGAAGPEPVLTAEQSAQREELLRKESEIAGLIAGARRPLREQAEKEAPLKSGFPGDPEDWQDFVDARVAQLAGENETCRRLETQLRAVSKELAPMNAPISWHGYVWVYLRK